VREEPLTIVKRLQDQSCLEKTEAVFECELNKPNIAVEWFYNGQSVGEAFPGQAVVSSDNCKYTLTLPSVNVKDQGVFSVVTPNKLKTQALLTVDEMAADFTVELEDKHVKEGETVRFSCEVNKEGVKVKWMLNGERLVEDENIKIDCDECVRTMTIKKTVLGDAGRVSCVLPGNKASNAKLTIEEIPVGIKLQTVEVFEGEDAKFEAVLDKQVPKKDTEWLFKDTKLAVAGMRYNQDCDRSQVTHRLVIKECTMADGGEYTFKARKGQAIVKLIVKELPVKLLKPLVDQNPLEHSSVSFNVSLSRPGHTVKWFLDGVECQSGDKFVPKQDGPQAFSLIINDCLIPDSGRVKVKVYNDNGDEVLSSEAKLTVSELPVDVVKGLENLRCMEKDEVTFVCEFNKEVKPGDVRWFKDGIKLVDGEDKGRIEFVHQGSKQCLVIKSALMSDIGSFEIKVKDVNSVGSLKVKEEEIVFVKKLLENYSPTEGETLVLECSTNKDKVNCEWKKYGKPLEMDSRMSVDRDGKVHRLTISNVKMSDKMNVSCVAVKGREEVATTSGKIVVKDGPVKVLKGLEDMTVNEGTEALLKVELNRENEQVEWFRDGVPVASGSGVRVYSVGGVYFLRISECSPNDHPGLYSFKCKDANTSGKLTVVPKPIAIVRPLSDKVTKEFQTVKFEVELNKPDLADRIVWQKNGEAIDVAANPDKYEVKASGPVYSLTIKDTQFEDEAPFSVQVKDTDVKSTGQLSVTEAPLEWIRTLKDIELKENQTATFECEINKDDVPVQWFKNGQKLVPSDNVVIKSVGRVHRLTLKNCLPETGGKYSCKPPGLSSQAQLYLEEIPVEFMRKLDNVKVVEGETGVFECELNKTNADVQWFRAGREIVDGQKYKYVCNGNKYSLEVKDCQLEDMSDFTIALRGRKSTANLIVEDRPATLLRPLTDKTVAEKQEIRLECEFDRANIEALWLVNNVDVKYALGMDRFKKIVNGGVYQLVVYEAKLDDAGRYSCTVKKTETNCAVKVTEQVVEVVKPLEDQEVVEKQTATFSCSLSKPRLNVTWFKNGVKLPENEKYQSVKEGKVYKLVIKNAALEDEDKYTIKYLDECESSADLRVLDAPNKLKSSQLGDKEATEEDKAVSFELETTKKFKASDKIRWSVNGRKLDHEDSSKYSMEAVSATIARFTIKNVRLEDEGSYQAEMNGTKANGYLSVNELPPRFVKPLSDTAGIEDEAALFECELSKAKWKKSGQDIVVKWFRGEREIKETTKYGFRRSGVRHSLEIRQLAFEDISEYSASVMTERTSGNLTISEGGVEFVTKMKDVEVEEKETGVFEVEVNRIVSSASGQTIPYVWSRRCGGNGGGGESEVLEKGSHFQMTNIGKKLVLKVNESTMEDPGTYSVKIGGASISAKLTVNEIPVVFKRPLKDLTGKEGQSCCFEATVNRDDKPVKWFVDGKQVTRDEIQSGKYLVKQDKCRLSLTINDLEMDKHHDIQVTCQCGEKAKCKAQLTLEEDDIRFVERLVDLGVKETDSAQFTCRLNKIKYETRANKKLEVRWFVKGKEVRTVGTRYRTEQVDTVLKLNICGVCSHEDAGEIKCEVNGKITTVANLYAEEEPVIFIRRLEDVIVHEIPGEAKFECELNKSFVNILWLRKGEEISESDRRFVINRDGGVHSMCVRDVDVNDVGEFTAQIVGKSQKKCTAELSIRAACKMFLDMKYKDTVTIKRGQALEIEVPFSGYPLPKFEWVANDEVLCRGSRVKTEMIKNKLVTLQVSKTHRGDSGKYTLTLENEVGVEKANIRVNVLDRPGPPRNPSVSEVYANEMRVNWSEPSDDGGSPITGYVVEIKESDRQTWTELDTKNYNELFHYARKLTTGTKYSYRISAVNKYGQSEPVETKEPVEAKYPFNVPDAPVNVVALDVCSDSCVVHFEPPFNNGGSPIIGYFIERKQVSANRWLRVNKKTVPELNFKVEDLVEDFEYEMRVIAVNLAGESLPSEPCKPFIAKNQFNRPSPPLNLEFGLVTKSSIELNWKVPESDGGSPITGYKVEMFSPKTYRYLEF